MPSEPSRKLRTGLPEIVGNADDFPGARTGYELVLDGVTPRALSRGRRAMAPPGGDSRRTVAFAE